MQIVSADIGKPIDECWRAFVDHAAMISWVPGLRAAELVASRADGLPEEIRFEFLGGLVYTLVYTYDVDGRVVRWAPKRGDSGAVRGFARFEAIDDGTRFTYALEHDTGRKALERAFDDPELAVQAFSLWMHER